MNSKRSSIREVTISRDNIVAQVAAFLYTTGVVSDKEEVINIQFSDLFGNGDTELCKIKIFVKKDPKEVTSKKWPRREITARSTTTTTGPPSKRNDVPIEIEHAGKQ